VSASAAVAVSPVATMGTVVARRAVGAYHLVTIAAPDVVASAVPGQFVSVAIDAPGALLRRPFAVAGIDPRAGVLDLAVAVVGRGSAWLARVPVSTMVALTGPLGTGFTAPTGPTRCLLVGGGYGVAALAWLARRLIDAGHAVELLSGARSAAALYPVPELAGRDGAGTGVLELHEVTEDGSSGQTGLVTDLLAARLGPDAGGAHDTAVFGCGPMPMLAAVAGIAAAHRRPCQVAVEEHMGCAVGVCMTCVVPTADGYVRACIDGPVLDAAVVDWAAVGDRHAGSSAASSSGTHGAAAGAMAGKALRDDRVSPDGRGQP
jgi:dihydroorotate dehydrogenase electron transfer subunit